MEATEAPFGFEPVAKSDAIREIGLAEGGKVLLEELLLQAAKQVSEHGADGPASRSL